jgi:hypothetical protein
MPAPPPAFYATNVLESAVLTLTPGGAVPGKGPDRLVDRDIGLECEDNGTAGIRTWAADRGVDAPADVADVWILAGTGIAGVPFALASSPDGTTWTARGTVTPPSDAPTRVALAPFAVPRYVQWTTTDPPAPVRLSEVFLSPALVFKWKPAAGTMREPQVLNVNTSWSVSGRGWGNRRGPRKWSSVFVMTSAPDTDRVKMLALLDELADTAKPCYLLTVTGELRFVRVLPPIDASGVSKSPSGEWDLPVSVVEELP